VSNEERWWIASRADRVDTLLHSEQIARDLARHGSTVVEVVPAERLRGAERWRKAVVAAYDLVAHDEGRSDHEILQQLREDLHDALGSES
jgi:hypothetical protein